MIDIYKILPKVQQPARYTGGEFGIPKIKTDAPLRYLMCFPDAYEVAMSNLGTRILYYMLNERADASCERCFAPMPDFADALRAEGLPLFSLESRTAARNFDMLGFSLQYELSYSNVLYMLDLAEIPLLRAERGDNYPIIMAGGPCTVNPEPMRDIFDVFVIGDGEDVLQRLCDLWVSVKKDGGGKAEFLRNAAQLESVFVPGITVGTVKRAVVRNLENAYFPTQCMVSNIQAVFDRANIEVFRGCTRGCRFCQAGFIYRPVRERSPENLIRTGEEILRRGGFDELSLTSLSTGDYSALMPLITGLRKTCNELRANLALPSLRLDSFEGEFTEDGRSGSLTFAPEAGTQRLRDVINKNVTDDDIDRAMIQAFRQGRRSIKLYFMIGLPTETDEDIAGIVAIARRIKRLYRENGGGKGLTLSVSTSTFIPKPFTPFQWEAQIPVAVMRKRQDYLKTELKKAGAGYHYHDNKTSVLEAVFSRGDARLAAVLITAYRDGARFDGWTEHFNFGAYERAFAAAGITMDEYLTARDIDAPLPWDYVDIGVTKKYLLDERAHAYAEKSTPDCRGQCRGCGLGAVCASEE